MKKRIGCLVLAFLFFAINVISPAYAAGITTQEDSSYTTEQQSVSEKVQSSDANIESEGDEISQENNQAISGDAGEEILTEENQESLSKDDSDDTELTDNENQTEDDSRNQNSNDLDEPNIENSSESSLENSEQQEQNSENSSESNLENDEEQQEENGETNKEESLKSEEASTVDEENSDITVEENKEDTLEIVEKAGQVDVSISAAMSFKKDIEFKVSLLLGSEIVDNQTILLESESSQTKKVSFGNLAAGEYELKVAAPGFQTYSQIINVEQNGYSVKLMTGFVEGYTYEEGSVHPGVLLIGDVNKDNSIDETDKDLLINAIDAGDAGNADIVADLNGDNEVNLSDLEYFVKGYRASGELEATVEGFVPTSVIKPTVAEGTVVTEGSLEELLSQSSSIKLQPANEEAISEENPVKLEFDFANMSVSGSDENQIPTTDAIVIGTGNEEEHVTGATISVVYIDENGEEQEMEVSVTEGISAFSRTAVTATIDANGTIHVNLGSQIAVKKVAITIFGTKNNNLAEISSVEFVNGMENRIPEVQMDIPEGLQAVTGSKIIHLSWNACQNITGYEVQISFNNKTETIQVTGNSLAITSFGGKELENLKTYKVKVQSINGTWSSGYCDEVEATPQPTQKPDKPDNVTAVGKYRSIALSWKNMKDTESYNVYYKQRNSEDEYTKVEGLKTNTYTITGLADLIEYEIYVTGVNGYGESPDSLHCLATTTDLNLAVVPKYGLINYTDQSGKVSEHIINATGSGTMKDSPLDTEEKTAWGTVDDDESSYYYKGIWDDGGYNPLGSNGLTYEFDQAYKMDTIRFRQHSGARIGFIKVKWWDESGNDQGEVRSDQGVISLSTGQDSAGRTYYEVVFSKPITAKKIQLGFAIYPQEGSSLTIADVYFYHYDTLMEDVMTTLYEDDLHTILKETTTQEKIDQLRERVNTADETSGEYNPNKESMLRELEMAEKILKDGALKDAKSIPVHTEINTVDVSVNRGFGGLNAWQPLGVTAAAGEEVTIYVGSDTQKIGETTNLRLHITQYHSESNAVDLGYYSNLKVGANTYKLVIPSNKLAEQENGGALYIENVGSTTNTRYAVRVSGGVQVPILDLYKVTDDNERLAKTTTYVEELETYVASMEETHNQVHKGSSNDCVNYEYDEKNCILGASDIMLDKMMFSLPAQQILSGAGTGTAQQKAQNILDSMDAMEDMMHLFYQHKGLNENAAEAANKIPSSHLNIRYQRMFSGAFMYASGNHIGIEYPETKSMVTAKPVVSEDGKYVSGNYFGWGIGHEIGHCINQSSYAVAEITNNYFAQLAEAKDTNTGMRFDYRNIYDKVTSGTKGASSNGATQLGMYWQLHLAYDKGYNYKTYDNYDEQLANLFYARMDTYARTPSKAPKPGNVALTLDNGSSDQNLMRLACAAAEKNILEFFERWGKVPNETTKAYAAQFEKETRAICYVSDDSRVYSMNGESSLSSDGTTEAVGDVSYQVNPNIANQVEFTFSSTNISADDILGYEITRCMISNGEVEKQVVGFTTNNTFSDTITSVNNRAVYYEITLIDKYLNRSAVKKLEQLKIEHDGSLDKTNWTISVTDLRADEKEINPDDNSLSCEVTKENAALSAIDHDVNTEYIATAESDNAEIEMTFNKTEVITGFKYTAGGSGDALGDYEVLVQSNGTWTTAAQGTFGGETINTVYFANADKKYVSTYEADAVKLIIKGKNGSALSIAELDVLGVTGDNVDFRRANDSENTTVIGTLKGNYQYGEKETDVIPEGSTIFIGSYKGNPAYNVVLLYDQDGNIVGGVNEEGALKAQQIILADVPDEGNIADTSDGTWIYWIEPEQNVDLTSITSVRTELYRVNDALTNEGQRLVSDSLFENMPNELPEIELGGQGVQVEIK